MSQSPTQERPKIGVGVIVVKEGKILIGKRKTSLGTGDWCFPGGHLEFGESVESCAKRETLEEAGIQIKNVKKVGYTEDIFKEKKHYITLYMISEYKSGTVTVCEPEKCETWEWFSWNKLPSPLFLPIQHLIQNSEAVKIIRNKLKK